MFHEDGGCVTREGNEQNDSTTQTPISDEFALHHCSKPLTFEELQKGTNNLVESVGVMETISRVEGLLRNDDVGVVNIYGFGGGGKTTLLKILHEKLYSRPSSGFDVAIMVTSSKDFPQNMKIQKDIGEQLGLSLSAHGSSFLLDIQANILRQVLSEKSFLLLLDGPQEINWNKIGIPISDEQNRCKVIITTNMKEGMQNVKTVKMSSLEFAESRELFMSEVQKETTLKNGPLVSELVDKAVKECNGLPLAVIIVGGAMANMKKRDEWLDAIKKLDSLAKVFPSTEHGVQYAVKFGYDNLQNDTLRSCFLYCSLFPEHYSIHIEELIRCWFGEGLLCDDDIDSAQRRGYDVIRHLKEASLLEARRDIKNEVKMHDVVRDFALQLTSAAPGKSDIFLVHAGSESKHAPKHEEWKEATMISLMHSKIEALPSKIPKCRNLSTLLINNNSSLKQIPKYILKNMPVLRVLDLSYTGIEMLPKAIGSLSKLQYLNLSRTYIRSLPEELGGLLHLRQLDLSYIPSLLNIPRRAISKLSKLQTLNLYETAHWCIQELADQGMCKRACIEDLKNLHQLKDLRLTIASLPSLQNLQCHSNLLKSITLLSLDEIEGMITYLMSDILKELDSVQVLQINGAFDLEELRICTNQVYRLGFLSLEHLPQASLIVESPEQPPFQMLRHLHIIECHQVKDLQWACRLPCLECIKLRVCFGIEALITSDGVFEEEVIKDNDIFFPKLKTMLLLGLPMLNRISTPSLSLPSLEYLEVCHCPKLNKLPFGLPSAKKIKEIRCCKEWWDGLTWVPQSVKLHFCHHFRNLKGEQEEEEEKMEKKIEEKMTSKEETRDLVGSKSRYGEVSRDILQVHHNSPTAHSSQGHGKREWRQQPCSLF